MEEITDENLTVDILKRKFPKCKWNDASNRDHNEIHKIVKICWNVEDLYIFIKKNKKNSIFFGEILIQEISRGIQTSDINIIILNKDNYFYFCEDSKNIIDSIQAYLDNF